MKANMEPGDVVMLKSGGPWMTVIAEVTMEKEKGPFLSCVWFGDDKHFLLGSFQPYLLKRKGEED